MQEGRAARAAAVFDRLVHVAVAVGQVEAVGGEVVEVRAAGAVARHPAVGRLDRDADAVVLAHEQHRRRQPLVGGTRRGVERGLRGGWRSEENTSELQSLMRSSYAVFCLRK